MSDRPREPLPFPEWMSAVQARLYDMQTRLNMCGAFYPFPAVTQIHFALYGELDPQVSAALIMRDEIAAQRARFG